MWLILPPTLGSKAKLEIEQLHEKIDLLREVMQQLQAVESLLPRLNSAERREASS
jgi:hypothetical protein